MTQSGVEAALNWIEENKTAPDFEEQLFMVKPEKPVSNLTPEEAKQKAKELQQKLRADRAEKDKALQFQNEIDRMKSGKEITDAMRKREEQEIKRNMEAKKREKEADEKAKAAILEQLEKDKRERMGKNYVPKEAITKTAQKSFEEIYEKMRKIYLGKPEGMRVCFKTLLVYMGNIIKNPSEPKFRKINAKNPNFQARVGNILGGLVILKDCGFEEDSEGFLVLKQDADINRIKDYIGCIDGQLAKISE